MKSIKLSLALLLLSGASLFAQVQALAKPVTVVSKIRVSEQPKSKKVNPLYSASIQRKTSPAVDTDAEGKTTKSLNASAVAEIKAFPNPFSTQIDVIITDGNMSRSVYKANLYDINGRLVHSEVLTANQSSMPLVHLSKGMYLLHIERNGSVVKQEKFIKE